MPIYEYKCPKCGVVEVMRGIKEASLKKCPTCKSKVERMISSSSFVLKGSGWYATDYAKKSPPSTDTSSASNDTNGNASSSEASKPSTESKPGAEKSASPSETKSAAPSEKAAPKPASSAKPTSSSKSD
jgi:putative FmdB family regulatory protein